MKVLFSTSDQLNKYVTSMLFDSGEVIASGKFESSDGTSVSVDLKVCGDVSVTFKGEVYHKPSEFPDELIERIKAHPDDWDVYAPSGEENDEPEGDIYVGLNNWFEYIWTNNKTKMTDGIVCEQDISKMNASDIFKEMLEVAQYAASEIEKRKPCINYEDG